MRPSAGSIRRPSIRWHSRHRRSPGRHSGPVIDTREPPERAFLVGLDLPRAHFEAEDSLSELASLVEAAGGVVAGRTMQARRAPDPHTWVGKGKAAELAAEAGRVGAEIVVTDDELTPTQQRGLEAVTNRRVVDRSAVILDIFARRARTKEGRVQVELAQLEYQMPRLRGIWKGLSRLGGGIGTRGPGESLLETDRRVIERRLLDLRARLAQVQQQRERSRRARGREGLFLAALVGYTNAGKSTLMNALSGAEVLVADQPFATLDPTTRRMSLPGGGALLVSDTVGFVNKLQPTLVAAFRATLASLELADRESLLVFNKADVLRGAEGAALREALVAEFPGALFVSARTSEGVEALRARLAAAAASRWTRIDVTLPYRDGGLVQRVRERGSLRNAEYGELGIHIQAEVPPDL